MRLLLVPSLKWNSVFGVSLLIVTTQNHFAVLNLPNPEAA